MLNIRKYPLRDKYGVEYYNLKKHQIRMWNTYKIHYDIDNKHFNIKTYIKQA